MIELFLEFTGFVLGMSYIERGRSIINFCLGFYLLNVVIFSFLYVMAEGSMVF